MDAGPYNLRTTFRTEKIPNRLKLTYDRKRV
jgi:hypothetical protein